MNWDDLRIFLTVARAGSISGAAKQLKIQHSTVSRRMRQLERKLGARLIERIRGGYGLTQAGEQISEAAKRMEREVLSVDDSLLGEDAKLTGTLRVSTINNMASSILMPIFAEFSTSYPQIELHIMVSNLDASLSQREADVAIRLTNSPTDTLVGKRIVTVASTVYGSRDYLNSLSGVGGEPKWLGVECCGFHQSWTKQACDSAAHRFYSDDTLITLAAIKQGLGVSILPCFLGDADPVLERYCEPDPAYQLGLWILLHPDLKHTGRVLVFRDFVANAILEQRHVFEGKPKPSR